MNYPYELIRSLVDTKLNPGANPLDGGPFVARMGEIAHAITDELAKLEEIRFTVSGIQQVQSTIWGKYALESEELEASKARIRENCPHTSTDRNLRCLVCGFRVPDKVSGSHYGSGVGIMRDPMHPIANHLEITIQMMNVILTSVPGLNPVDARLLSCYLCAELSRLYAISERVSEICREQQETLAVADHARQQGDDEIEAIQEACEHVACHGNGVCIVCDYDTSEYPDG